MNRTIIYLMILMPFLFLGCTNTSPTKDDINGIWTSTDGAELDLNEDGIFIGKSLPADNFFRGIDFKGQRFNGVGVWEVKTERETWDQLPWKIELDFNEIENDTSKHAYFSILISGSGVLENKPPWRSLFLWKEEDGGERYEFKKM